MGTRKGSGGGCPTATGLAKRMEPEVAACGGSGLEPWAEILKLRLLIIINNNNVSIIEPALSSMEGLACARATAPQCSPIQAV